jgi:hypothetical protein
MSDDRTTDRAGEAPLPLRGRGPAVNSAAREQAEQRLRRAEQELEEARRDVERLRRLEAEEASADPLGCIGGQPRSDGD